MILSRNRLFETSFNPTDHYKQETMCQTKFHEFHETCDSVTFYFMKKLIFWHYQEAHFTKYDSGGNVLQ